MQTNDDILMKMWDMFKTSRKQAFKSVWGVQGCQRYFIIFFSEFCLWNTMKNQCNLHWKETQRNKLSDQKVKNCKILQLSSYLYTLHKEQMSTQIVQMGQMKAKAMEHWITHEDETLHLN